MEVENEKMNSIHYDSITEIIEFDTNQLVGNNRSLFNQYLRQSLGNKSVITAPTAQDCIKKAYEGDTRLYNEISIPKMSQLDSQVDPADYAQLVEVKRRKRIRSSHGNELDIHSVYQGKIDKAWDTTTIVKSNQEVNFITILADIGENWGVHGMDSTWTMAVLNKLSDICEMAGKNVQIIVGDCGRGTNGKKSYTTISCVIKRYNERLSPERLAAMTHLGFFRSFCFLGLATSKIPCYESLGTHVSFSDDLLPINIKEQIDQGHTKVLIVKGSLSLSAAKDSLKRSLDKLHKIVYSTN